jgi:hypothetical protein
MLRRCRPFVIVASLAIPGGAVQAFSAFVDISATDLSTLNTAGVLAPTQATPTGVSAGGVTVLQGPLNTANPGLFYNAFLYPGAPTLTISRGDRGLRTTTALTLTRSRRERGPRNLPSPGAARQLVGRGTGG